MRSMRRFALIGILAVLTVGLGSSPSSAQPRPHVYLLRGLMNIFSLGMDALAEKIQRHGIYATVHNHSEWQGLADQAAAAYKAGTEGPIILIGHSLGADAVMEMSAYLGRKGVPVALVVPFDGTKSFSTPSNVGRLVNLTQRDYAYMHPGPGFHGSLTNVDVSSDPSIGHISIDKSARLHAQVIGYILSVVGSSHHNTASAPHNHNGGGGVASPGSGTDGAAKPGESLEAPAKPASGATGSHGALKPVADSGTPVIARPEKPSAAAGGFGPE